jgi:hypothetical protein
LFAHMIVIGHYKIRVVNQQKVIRR